MFASDDELREVLRRVAAGELTPDEAQAALARGGYRDLGFAKIDTDRERRIGAPEVVFCQGKTPEQILNIVRAIDQAGQNILCTRVEPETAAILRRHFEGLEHDATARVLTRIVKAPPAAPRAVGVIAAGTTDLPVAAEAAATARFLGAPTVEIADVGVAGIHRLFGELPRVKDCGALVVVAGMEGALASVVGGLVDVPVIAVPTHVGYGAAFGGLAALLGMLNSCSPGVSVVNIDNGFGAGYQAALICRRASALE